MKRRKGFTLIEMMIVVLVIAILALIVGLAVKNAGARSKNARYIADLAALNNAATLYINDTGGTPDAALDCLLNDTGETGWQGPYLSANRINTCPIDGASYTWDNGNRQVICPGAGPHPQ